MKLIGEVDLNPFKLDRNFVKEIKWSPDGTCLLSNSADHNLRLFEFKCENKFFKLLLFLIFSMEHYSFHPSLLCHEGEEVLDYCWYPGMSSQSPSTCCFLSTSKDHPIHLWDAYSGKVCDLFFILILTMLQK
jgi:WD40 repeat protein